MFQLIANNLFLGAISAPPPNEGLKAGGLDQAVHSARRRGGLKKAEQVGRSLGDV